MRSTPTLSVNIGSAQETVLDDSPGSSCTSNDWGQSLTRGVSESERNNIFEISLKEAISCAVLIKANIIHVFRNE